MSSVENIPISHEEYRSGKYKSTKSKSLDAHDAGVGFYSLMVVRCLAIPGKRKRSNCSRFLFMYSYKHPKQ